MSRTIAKAVALAAQADGVASDSNPDDLDAAIAAKVWEPVYTELRPGH